MFSRLFGYLHELLLTSPRPLSFDEWKALNPDVTKLSEEERLEILMAYHLKHAARTTNDDNQQSLGLAAPVAAGPLEDATAAYEQGRLRYRSAAFASASRPRQRQRAVQSRLHVRRWPRGAAEPRRGA